MKEEEAVLKRFYKHYDEYIFQFIGYKKLIQCIDRLQIILSVINFHKIYLGVQNSIRVFCRLY